MSPTYSANHNTGICDMAISNSIPSTDDLLLSDALVLTACKEYMSIARLDQAQFVFMLYDLCSQVCDERKEQITRAVSEAIADPL